MPAICQALILLFIAFFAFVPKPSYSADFVPEQMVCAASSFSYIDTINANYGTMLIRTLPEINSYLLQTQPGQDADSLAGIIGLEPYVIYCDANFILDAPEPVQGSQPFIDFQVQGTFEGQGAAGTLRLPLAQTASVGTGVKVGVIDVGVNFGHPILSPVTVSGTDYVAGDSDAFDEPGGNASGHGTFVAGVISLVAPEAEIHAYRVLDTAGRGNGFTIAEAIVQAVDDGCKVINLSMVMTGNHGSMDAAIEYAHTNNVLVVAAAGNDSTEIDRFPARDSYTLSVAALDSLNQKADFSSFGGKVDVCAPGTMIYSPFLDTMYAWWNGSSFAAPFVAGQAALLYAAQPNASWNEVVDAITQTATNIDAQNPGLEGKLGTGLIDPVAALAQFMALSCGDINDDGVGPNLTDATMLVNHLFITFEALPNPMAADVDNNGSIALTDLTRLINFMFLQGPALNCGP